LKSATGCYNIMCSSFLYLCYLPIDSHQYSPVYYYKIAQDLPGQITLIHQLVIEISVSAYGRLTSAYALSSAAVFDINLCDVLYRYCSLKPWYICLLYILSDSTLLPSGTTDTDCVLFARVNIHFRIRWKVTLERNRAASVGKSCLNAALYLRSHQPYSLDSYKLYGFALEGSPETLVTIGNFVLGIKELCAGFL
jgi:hypothetical protein